MAVNATRSRNAQAADCLHCRGGSWLSFNWAYLRLRRNDDDRQRFAAFAPAETLRHGALYRCCVCSRLWHLDAAGLMMSVVSEDRLPLVRAWSQAPIRLPEAVQSVLEAIGETPPDIYGSGAGYVQTPCTVITKAGERVDLAIVSRQEGAPIEPHRPPRLASDIAEVRPSPFALPLAVRQATARAEELRTGFAPTLIEMPDGARFALNFTQHFLTGTRYDAGSARLAPAAEGVPRLPQPVRAPEGVVYFIADP